MFNTCYQWFLSFFYAVEQEQELDLNDFRVVDIDGKSWEMTLPTFPAAPLHVLIGHIQPGMSYGVQQEYKNKWMRIEGNSLISGWIPDQFIIQTLDGERYNFYWVNRQNPIKNPQSFRPIYRLQSRGRTMSDNLEECDSSSDDESSDSSE